MASSQTGDQSQSEQRSSKRTRFRDLSAEEQEARRDSIRHSAAHVLAEAVLKRIPEAKLTIGPPIRDGFYYDFDVPQPFTPGDLAEIEDQMRASIRANTAFVEREVERDAARELVADNPYKLEILDGIPAGERVTFCSHSDGGFEDLCRGGHVESTGEIKAFKLLSTAGAYWRGSEANPMLQRIYGTAWESREAMRDHLKRREEAERRDHRRLGSRMGLYFFDPVAPSNPFFLPKGAFVYNTLVDYVRELYGRYGYDEVITPQMFKTDLFKTSGHYDNYIDSMYMLQIDEQEYGIKPMNCPSHAVMYRQSLHSYRDLPIRYADFGRLHRYELSGVTQGLTRVRSFSQDDAHIFCTPEQVAEEVNGFINMLSESYDVFGFDRQRYVLSLRPDKRVGSDADWDRAESALQSVLESRGDVFELAPGEGAFYGPKIDIFVPDALDREWQLGTVQVDFNQPERFDLEYVKPMNCPSHAVMYRQSLHSYRDLPIRYADFGRLHRYELSGVTQGLTRVRSFSQDDAHIFCTPEQVAEEVNGFINMLSESYDVFGFDRQRYVLSLRPDKRVGSDADWDRAESALQSVLESRGDVFELAPGEGAFYGPKIDIFVPDALDREWQLGTVQVDFNQPERFDLEYVKADGARDRTVMIHRAMLGSLERFMGVLIEHLAGNLPLWLAPSQAVVIPIADRHNEYADTVAARMSDCGLRATVNDASERMNAKIRDAQLQKINYMLVAGDRESESGSVSVRTRAGDDLGAKPLQEVIEMLTGEVASRALES